jgi:uncharacterized RDD family membrane protein YckC
MHDEQRTHSLERADPDPSGVMSPTGSSEIRPGFCPDCDAAVSGHALFCPTCHVFLPDQWVGRLAPAKRRLVAALLDGVFKDGGVLGLAFWNVVLPPGLAVTAVRIMSAIYGVSALVFWSRGTTPAKRLLDLTVITEDGKPAGFFRMAFRETIGKWISTIAFGLGLLAITTNEEKRGWHDRMAGTWVVLDEDD